MERGVYGTLLHKAKILRRTIVSPVLTIRRIEYYMPEFLTELDEAYWARYRFLNKEETLEFLLENRKGFIRYGDGEFSLMFGSDVGYQRYSPAINEALGRILRSYAMQSPYLLGLPSQLKWSFSEMRRRNLLGIWKKGKILLRHYLSEDCVYGDPFLFRSSGDPEYIPLSYQTISQLWIGKCVILVGSMVDYFKEQRLVGAAEQYLVEAPIEDAFPKRNEIVASIRSVILKHRLTREQTVILIALGPAAKVLSYDLCHDGWLTYDVGAYFDGQYQRSW